MASGGFLDRILAAFDRLAKTVSPHVPYTAPYQVRTAARVGAGWSILDLGCGKGEKTALFAGARTSIVGADLWLPYLQQCRRLKVYDDLVLCDVRQLPFRERSFDLVVCLELLEHLGKNDGYKLLDDLEHIARRKVVVSVPSGVHVQSAYDDNPHQEHISTWTPSELRRMNYRVRVNSIRNTAGETGIAAKIPPLLSPPWRILNVLLGPVLNLRPEWGGHMVADKDL